jgi:hypothetical protein
VVPFRLDLKKGKVFAVIMVIDEFSFHHMRRQEETVVAVPWFEPPPRLEGTRQILDVRFGGCVGKKYLGVQTAPFPWKQVRYLLAVPGGFVSVDIGTLTGANFDESDVESKLHSLLLSPVA